MKARSWVDPLRFLLKKELTATDVGELGRIILPKVQLSFQLLGDFLRISLTDFS